MFEKIKKFFQGHHSYEHLALHTITVDEIKKLKEAQKEQELAMNRLEFRFIMKLRNKCKKLKYRIKQLENKEQQVPMFQSGKSHLASDTVEEDAAVDGISLKGESGIQFFVRLLEQQKQAEALLEAQQRMIVRLYRIANSTVIDPYKSITEDLRKAEKWKKKLQKKLKEYKENTKSV